MGATSFDMNGLYMCFQICVPKGEQHIEPVPFFRAIGEQARESPFQAYTREQEQLIDKAIAVREDAGHPSSR